LGCSPKWKHIKLKHYGYCKLRNLQFINSQLQFILIYMCKRWIGIQINNEFNDKKKGIWFFATFLNDNS
jgi:hypothetical protein